MPNEPAACRQGRPVQVPAWATLVRQIDALDYITNPYVSLVAGIGIFSTFQRASHV